MVYREFMEAAEKGIRDRLGEEAAVTRDRVRKNNAVFLDALFIREKGETVSPVLYLQDFYRIYRNGMEFEAVLDEMVACYRRGKCARELDMSFFSDPGEVRRRVYPRLISRDRNRETLPRLPHRTFQDLAIVYYCWMEKSGIGDAAVLISEEHRGMWGMREEDLYEAGRENLYRRLPWVFVSMEDLLVSLLPETLREGGGQSGGYPFRSAQSIIAEEKARPVPMYVLTNDHRKYGAIWITEEQVLGEIGEKIGEDYYVLPSSVHECIILPESVTSDRENLRRLVEDVNRSQVAPEEVLSDSVYYYERDAKSLTIVQAPI